MRFRRPILTHQGQVCTPVLGCGALDAGKRAQTALSLVTSRRVCLIETCAKHIFVTKVCAKLMNYKQLQPEDQVIGRMSDGAYSRPKLSAAVNREI